MALTVSGVNNRVVLTILGPDARDAAVVRRARLRQHVLFRTGVAMFACMHVLLRTGVAPCTCINVAMLACTYVCLRVCLYVCVYVCMYACMHVFMYACMYECIRTVVVFSQVFAVCLCTTRFIVHHIPALTRRHCGDRAYSCLYACMCGASTHVCVYVCMYA